MPHTSACPLLRGEAKPVQVSEFERQEAIHMSKVAIGARTLLYPVPAVLVGANVDGKANFSTHAWCGIVASSPPSISVSFQHKRHTLKGVRQNQTFSVNIPSVDLVKETDYCRLVSGRDRDHYSLSKSLMSSSTESKVFTRPALMSSSASRSPCCHRLVQK